MTHRIDTGAGRKLRAALEHPAGTLWTCALWIGAALVLVGMAYIATGVDGHADAVLEDLVRRGAVAAFIVAAGAVIAAAIESLTDPAR